MNVTLSQIIDATWITIYISLFSFILGSIIAFILGFSLYFTRKGGIYENTKTCHKNIVYLYSVTLHE